MLGLFIPMLVAPNLLEPSTMKNDTAIEGHINAVSDALDGHPDLQARPATQPARPRLHIDPGPFQAYVVVPEKVIFQTAGTRR